MTMTENAIIESPPAAVSGNAARILVVDDAQSMRELLGIVLRREGHDVAVAENGAEALELLQQRSFDLLISDIKMPDMTGIDVLRAARAVDIDLTTILITAYASTDTAVEALRLGANDYVSKGDKFVDELKLKVRRVLEGRRLQQENLVLKRERTTAHQFLNIVGS